MRDSFDVHLPDSAQLRVVAERELKHGGVFVRTETPPPLFASFRLSLKLLDLPNVDVPARVVNLAAGGFFAQFEAGPERDALASAVDLALTIAVNAEPARVDAAPAPEAVPDGPPPPLAGAVRPAWELIDMGSGVPIHQQVKELTTAEKLKLARAAARPVRAILIRDAEKRIHINIVKNPKVTLEEVREWTAMPGISPLALKWIADQPTFARNSQIQLNLVKNPQSPRDVALKMLSLLPTGECLKIARSTMVREAISRAAKKRVMKAGLI